jgi:hypothetical protein
MSRTFLALALLASCGKPSLIAPDLASPVLTPSGALLLYPHTYGQVLPWHVETAEASWQRVAPCVGVDVGELRGFPVLLVPRAFDCNAGYKCAGYTFIDANPRIEIIGASHDFDPARPEATPGPTAEIARLWRHELLHLALHLRDGDLDARHEGAEWACEVTR